MSRRAIYPKIVLMLLITVRPSPCARGEAPTPEEKVKAADVFNFMEFTEWPAGTFKSADAPMIVGFVGETSMEAPFRAAAEKTVNGRKVVLKQVHSAEDAAACNVVVFAAGDCVERLRTMEILKQRSVLTIGEAEGFTEAGGVIRFYLEEGKVRFEVNTLAAERAHLHISSKLLKLARIVRK